MLSIEKEVLAAQNDKDRLEDLISHYEPFIIARASEISGRHLSKSEDEWSVALLAFYDTITTFDQAKGSFFSYARLIIKSRLIDYFRSQNKTAKQVSLDLIPENDLTVEQEDMDIKYEIQALEQILVQYGFSYLDLVDCSPKAQKTKAACRQSSTCC